MGGTCDSCGMPIEAGRYCGFCVDEAGQLQDFETRFDRMVAFRMCEAGGDQAEVERLILAHMATMPAWRDDPKLRARLAG